MNQQVDNALGGHEDIVDQNFAARLTRDSVAALEKRLLDADEIRMLLQGERRSHPNLERLFWEDAIRQAKLQLVVEDASA